MKNQDTRRMSGGVRIASTSLHDLLSQEVVDRKAVKQLITSDPGNLDNLDGKYHTPLDVFVAHHAKQLAADSPFGMSVKLVSDYLLAAGGTFSPVFEKDFSERMITGIQSMDLGEASRIKTVLGKNILQSLKDHALWYTSSKLNLPGMEAVLKAGANANAAAEFGVHSLFLVEYNLLNGDSKERQENVIEGMRLLKEYGANPHQTDTKDGKYSLRDGLVDIERIAYENKMGEMRPGQPLEPWKGFASEVKKLVRDEWKVQHSPKVFDGVLEFAAKKQAHGEKYAMQEGKKLHVQLAGKDAEIAKLRARLAELAPNEPAVTPPKISVVEDATPAAAAKVPAGSHAGFLSPRSIMESEGKPKASERISPRKFFAEKFSGKAGSILERVKSSRGEGREGK